MEKVIVSPFDSHLHLRDIPLLTKVIECSAEQFVGAIIMPNLVPPVVTAIEVDQYRMRIMSSLAPDQSYFRPYMTTYLTENSDPHDIRVGFRDGVFVAGKLYPPHGTTNSSQGVGDIKKIYPVLAVMEEIGMVLCVHGEMPPSSGIDIFDREKVFLFEKLAPLLLDFPNLKVVVEHVTTKEACDFVIEYNLQATITPQHLLFDRNALFSGGLQPDMYCLPILKKDVHRQRIQEVVIAGDKHFGLGTDSAPHLKENKYKACGCAGVFSAPVAIEAYYSFFAANGIEDKFQAFASDNMASFYGLDLPKKELRIMTTEEGWTVSDDFYGITPLLAGQKLFYKALISS